MNGVVDHLVDTLPFTVGDADLIGSMFIFGHGKDTDVIVYTGNLTHAFDGLREAGWEVDKEEMYCMDDSRWFSARKELVNLLVTDSSPHYAAMLTGAKISKALADHGILKYEDKRGRVIIHRVLTGESLDV